MPVRPDRPPVRVPSSARSRCLLNRPPRSGRPVQMRGASLAARVRRRRGWLATKSSCPRVSMLARAVEGAAAGNAAEQQVTAQRSQRHVDKQPAREHKQADGANKNRYQALDAADIHLPCAQFAVGNLRHLATCRGELLRLDRHTFFSFVVHFISRKRIDAEPCVQSLDGCTSRRYERGYAAKIVV